MPAPEGNDNALGNPGGGAPEGNGNALKHGATASPLNLLEHLEEEELRFVRNLVDAYIERAPFGPEDARVERLTKTVVLIFQEWRAEEVLLEDGLGRDAVVGVSSSGEPIVDTQEHYLCRTRDRLNDKIRHNLRDLGLLEEDVAGPGSPGSSDVWTASSKHMTVTIKETSSSSSSDETDESDDVDDE